MGQIACGGMFQPYGQRFDIVVERPSFTTCESGHRQHRVALGTAVTDEAIVTLGRCSKEFEKFSIFVAAKISIDQIVALDVETSAVKHESVHPRGWEKGLSSVQCS